MSRLMAVILMPITTAVIIKAWGRGSLGSLSLVPIGGTCPWLTDKKNKIIAACMIDKLMMDLMMFLLAIRP